MTIEPGGNGRRRDAGHGRSGGAAARIKGHSGRRFLIVSGVVVAALWGSLFLGFRQWRFHYRERAEFGRSRVVPAVDGLTDVLPPGGDISPAAWRDAVEQTHAMLETVVSANLLDLDQMKALRAELEAAVKRAKADPATARAELAAIWDGIADRGEFLLTENDRHPRPKVLPPRQGRGK
jgi:hypothetical protein